MAETGTQEQELVGEVVSEETGEAAEEGQVRTLPQRLSDASPPALRGEVRTAAIAVAGGAIAGVATVAAVRAVGSAGTRRKGSRALGRRGKPRNVVASRSFLVDVHLLDR
jgi:hypothetical protein